ncbi:MAG: DUF1549 domain-containing protein [Acidobacteria bacterium]|nr:DUF1549 domain-containing protein [Acidobacteriota bacterium]
MVRTALLILLYLPFAVPRAAVAEAQQSAPKRQLAMAKGTTSRTAPAAKPSDPSKAVELKVQPTKLVLTGPTDSRRLLISARLADGSQIDLSRSAKLTALDDRIRIDSDGFVSGLKEGESRIRVEERGLQAEVPVTVQTMTPSKISFVRDVMPIINKVGCTSGTCHGAAKGKNGFKLSLRGYDPHFDYEMLVHDISGRRINRVDPPRSLALAKPTMQVAHGGGMRFDLDSRYYQTLLQWISQGTLYGDPEASQVKRIEVLPGEILMPRPGLAQQIQVIARYADGADRDVTREASYTSSVPTVAEVTQDGHLTTLRRGEAALLIRYEGRFVPLPVTVLEGRPGFQWTQLPQHNYIDRHVDAKLKKVETLPSEIASDAEFLRRVYLDLIGIPPTPEETRAFLAEPGEQRLKRSRCIDKLMARSEFVDHWAVKWGDLFQNTRKFVGDKGVWQYRDWIRRSLAENKPYDQWVCEVLTAQGSTFENPAANFFRIAKNPKVTMETTTQVFLGIRMVCAQCHDHPFEQWTQNQYYQMAAFFSTIGVKEGIDSQEEIVYVKRNEEERNIKHPKSGNIVPAKYLFGDSKGLSQEGDRRNDLVRWLTSKDNPYFAKAVANRIWSYFFGRGIIDPVDDIRAGNPPSNEPLLRALTKDFTDYNFDLRHLIRTIVNSRTYQLTYRTNEWNQGDEVNFSHALPRRLPAETLFDAISVATGSALKFKDVPQNFRAQQFPDPTVGMGGFLDLFGRPQRDSACECERRSDVSLSQALNLINGSTVSDAIADPEGRIAHWVIGKVPDRKLVEELYLAALSRPPDTKEFELGLKYLAESPNRAEKAQDLMWALINSNAFLFNR